MTITSIPIPGFAGVQIRFTCRVAVALALHREIFHLTLRSGEIAWVPFGIFGSKRALTFAFLLASVTFTRLEKKLSK